MRQENSDNPAVLAIFQELARIPSNDGYLFESVDDTNVDGETPLHVVARVGDLDMGKILLDAGAYPNWPDCHYGNTPLHIAVSGKKHEFVGLLLSHGASQEITNDSGITPLDLAKQSEDSRLVDVFSSWPISRDKSQRPEVFAALKDASSTADNAGYVFKSAQDTNLLGETALHIAAIRGDIKVGKILLNVGANINAPGEYGNTPLHEAVGQRKYDFVKLLLDHGASKDIRNKDGFTPAEHAEQSGDQRLTELFRAKGIAE
jgi:ankyrin repeat protein